jgi:hypothetical protein
MVLSDILTCCHCCQLLLCWRLCGPGQPRAHQVQRVCGYHSNGTCKGGDCYAYTRSLTTRVALPTRTRADSQGVVVDHKKERKGKGPTGSQLQHTVRISALDCMFTQSRIDAVSG